MTAETRNHTCERLLVTLGLVAGLVLPAVFASPAAAQSEPESALPDQVVIFVIDLSGSMNEPFDSERTKLDVAKEAFVEAFTNVSDNAFVGIRVYGDQLAARAPDAREQNCTTDSRLAVPITQVDREALIAEVQGFNALGDTPIGLALRQANEDIPEGTLGTVVLFSDGRDECFDADLDGDATTPPSWGEDPCEVARDIAGEGVDLRIDRVETVGFQADEAAESELRCIADSTGGSYTPIESPEDARELLPELLAQISSPRDAARLGGEPIDGTPAQEGAPELDRLDGAGAGDGRYVDTIEMNSEKWYRMPEYGPGGGTFTATVFGLPAQAGIDFGMRMYLPETDQTFFEGRSDDDAGIPRRPTASIRCPGCSITGGPNDVYWIVSLTSENPDLAGSFDLELLTEGPAFGGSSSNCAEPQVCWYEQQITERTPVLEELRTQYDHLIAGAVSQELLDERDRLSAEASDVEAAAREAGAKAASLAAEAESLGGERSSFLLPGALAAVGLGMGAFGLTRRSARRTSDDATRDPVPSSAVIGHVSRDEEPVVEVEVTDDDDPGPERPEPEADRMEDGDLLRSAPDAEAEMISAGDEETEPSPSPSREPTETVDDEAGLETPEPGWYSDPEDPSRLRWWDGQTWTDHTHADEGGAS